MKLKYQFKLMELDDQIMAVPIGGDMQGVLKLNESAADIIKLLEDEKTEEAVCAELMKIYSSESSQDEEIKTFVHDYIAELDEAGLLE